jgi:uncharacterized protein (DUF2345 family)
MINQDELLDILDKRYSTDNKGDYFHVTTSLTAGIVVDTDDPLQQGRLRVFCPSHGDDPSKILQLPWAVYISPFGGTIANSSFERNGQTTTGAVSYGFWAIPEVGANVLVGCIDGDLRRRYWIGTMYDQQETHTLGNGRFKWSSGGSADGPLSSAGKPIQPAYDNAKASFGGNNNSPEWQARIADYSIAAVDGSLNQPPTPDKGSYLDQMQEDIAKSQQFGFNQDIVGSNGYDWSGFGGLSFKASKVIALTSPGFASITLDDRIFNSRTKLRSASGHMILMDDTNDRIYVKTNTGNAWMEMDSAGNVDVYSSRRISLSSDMDVNINAGGSVRIQGKEGVYIYAGTDNGLEKMSEAPLSGQVRIQAQNDLHLLSTIYRQMSLSDAMSEIGGNYCLTVGSDFSTQVKNDIDIITNDGHYNLSVTGDYNMSASGKANMFAIDEYWLASKSDVNIYSYEGTMNIASWENLVLKSMGGDVIIQSVGGNSETGQVIIKSPNSQIGVTDIAVTISTTGTFDVQSGGNTTLASNSPTDPGSNLFSVAKNRESFDMVMGDNNLLSAISCNPLAPSLSFSAGGLMLQATNDIHMISTSLNMSLPTLGGAGSILGKLNENGLQLDTLSYYANTALSTISTAIGVLSELNIPSSTILSEIEGYVSYAENAIQTLGALANIHITLPSSFEVVLPLITTGLQVNMECVIPFHIPSIDPVALTVFDHVRG